MKVPPARKPSAMRGGREQRLQFRHVLPFPPFVVDAERPGTGCHPTAREANVVFHFPDVLVTRSFVHLKKKEKKRKADL